MKPSNALCSTLQQILQNRTYIRAPAYSIDLAHPTIPQRTTASRVSPPGSDYPSTTGLFRHRPEQRGYQFIPIVSCIRPSGTQRHPDVPPIIIVSSRSTQIASSSALNNRASVFNNTPSRRTIFSNASNRTDSILRISAVIIPPRFGVLFDESAAPVSPDQ